MCRREFFSLLFHKKEFFTQLKMINFFMLHFSTILQLLERYSEFLELIFLYLGRILSVNHKNQNVEIHSIFFSL